MPDLSADPWGPLLVLIGQHLVPIAIIVVVALIALRVSRLFVTGIVRALFEREATEGTSQELSAVELEKRRTTLDELGGHVVRFFVVVIAGLMVLQSLDLDIGPAIAGLGIVGVAVGFGAQSLVRDYLNGALILIENQFSKGDVIQVASVSGVVEDFSLRRTTLRDLDGNVHTVPNGEISVATNMTRVWARINEDVMVGYGTDIAQAAAVIAEVGKAMADDPEWGPKILVAPKMERVQALEDSGVTLKILATVRAPDRWATAGELRKRLLTAFAAEGVEIPFPHRVIIGRPAAPTDGQAPAPSAATADGADAAAD
jgi:moderate conductance mechanosensitive channel